MVCHLVRTQPFLEPKLTAVSQVLGNLSDILFDMDTFSFKNGIWKYRKIMNIVFRLHFVDI